MLQTMRQYLAPCVLTLLILVRVHSASAEAPQPALDLFDGTPRTVVVNGYSTSFHWPNILQRKLNRYFEGQRVIEVKSATQGGTPIAKWMNVETGEPLTPWTNKLRPLLQQKQQPTVVLAQQSLQWVYGDRASGIRSPKDAERIQQGANALQKYTSLLLADGADAVVVSIHIYKKPMEPVVGNERLALAEFLMNQPPHVFAGPDVWEPTSKVWPQAFQADQQHPNGMGAEIMAHYWFATLLQLGGHDVPDWSAAEMQQAIANPPELPGMNDSSRPNVRSLLSARILRYDANKDGKVTQQEFKGPPRLFSRLDRNSDGILS
ncbi:MAG: hypothetical protein KDA69_20150, partial [Planctomycetaceae bacterium]|nr:hypothetical protein [Planctomycetaceae bacterium]